MGTAYYLRTESVPQYIGKREAAGLYCWDCEISLHKQGLDEAERQRTMRCVTGSKLTHVQSDWHKVCPKCGKAATQESLRSSGSGRPFGVASCAVFTWAKTPSEIAKQILSSKLEKPIVNEHDTAFTLEQFEMVLGEAVVHYTE